MKTDYELFQSFLRPGNRLPKNRQKIRRPSIASGAILQESATARNLEGLADRPSFMAADRYHTDYHLATDGWGETKAPETVPTIRREVEQSSMYSAEDVKWSEIWRAENATQEHVAELLAKHGAEPGGPGMPAPPRRSRRRRPYTDYL